MQFYGASMCLPPVWQALKNQILTHTGVTTCDISKHWIGCKGSCTAYMQKAFLLWVGACASWDCELECRSSYTAHTWKASLLNGLACASSGQQLVRRKSYTVCKWKIFSWVGQHMFLRVASLCGGVFALRTIERSMPIYALCLIWSGFFEDSLENALWRKFKQILPMWLCIPSGNQFEETLENTQWNNIKLVQLLSTLGQVVFRWKQRLMPRLAKAYILRISGSLTVRRYLW